MKISGAIFDLDGTLTDSMWVWYGLAERYLRHLGFEPRPGLGAAIEKMTLEEVYAYLCEEYGIVRTFEQMQREISELLEMQYGSEVKPKEGVIELLELFKSKGVRMCVASMTDRPLVVLTLESNNMLHYFDAVLSCHSVGAGKHEPLIFEESLSILGTPKNETPVFEDTLYAAKTAKDAGFPVVGVADRYSLTIQEELRSLSDIYVEQYSPELFDFN